MGVFDRLFGYKQKHDKSQNDQKSKSSHSRDINAKKLLECGSFIDTLLSANAYIARSDYKSLEKYSENIDIVYNYITKQR